jgi:hypothetical protein
MMLFTQIEVTVHDNNVSVQSTSHRVINCKETEQSRT